MRVAVDANIFISFLLAPESRAAAPTTVRAVLSETLSAVVPEGVFDEIRATATEKPYLAERILQPAVDELIGRLEECARIVPASDALPVHPSRDKGDDFFLKSAILDQVDAIVTRDKDILELAIAVAPVWITSPEDFVKILPEIHA